MKFGDYLTAALDYYSSIRTIRPKMKEPPITHWFKWPSTRNVVETAIDLSRLPGTWAELLRKFPGRKVIRKK